MEVTFLLVLAEPIDFEIPAAIAMLFVTDLIRWLRSVLLLYDHVSSVTLCTELTPFSAASLPNHIFLWSLHLAEEL